MNDAKKARIELNTTTGKEGEACRKEEKERLLEKGNTMKEPEPRLLRKMFSTIPHLLSNLPSS